MKFIATIAVLLSAFLMLVGCGSSEDPAGSTEVVTAVDSAEVAGAVKLMKRYERLNALSQEEVMRAGALKSEQAAKGMEEAAEEFGEEAKAIFPEINTYSEAVQRQAIKQIESERKR